MPPARWQHLCRVLMSSKVRAEDKRDKRHRTQCWGGIRCGVYLIGLPWDPDIFKGLEISYMTPAYHIWFVVCSKIACRVWKHTSGSLPKAGQILGHRKQCYFNQLGGIKWFMRRTDNVGPAVGTVSLRAGTRTCNSALLHFVMKTFYFHGKKSSPFSQHILSKNITTQGRCFARTPGNFPLYSGDFSWCNDKEQITKQ